MFSVLPDSPDNFLGLVSNPSCSLDQAILPNLDIMALGPDIKEPSPTSYDPVPDYLLVLPEVPDCSPFTPIDSTEEWDSFLSLVFDSSSPSCSLDNSYLLPEDSPCLLEDSAVLPEKPALDVEKGFYNLSSLVATLPE